MSELKYDYGDIVSITTAKISPSIAVSPDGSFFDICDSVLIIATSTNDILYRPIFGLEYNNGVLIGSEEDIVEEYWSVHHSVSKSYLRELVKERDMIGDDKVEDLDMYFEVALKELEDFGVKIIE